MFYILNIKDIQNNVGFLFLRKGVLRPYTLRNNHRKSCDVQYKPRHSSWMGSSEGFRDTSSSGKATLTTRHFGCITGNQIKAVRDTQISS